MINLTSLPKVATKTRKRVGRGYGSGKGGHTTGKGSKGQKIRTKVKLTNDGTKIKKSWLKRLPFLRGKGRNKTSLTKPYIVKTGQLLKHLKKDNKVDYQLISKIIKVPVSQLEKRGVKLLSSQKKIITPIVIDSKIKLSTSVKKKIVASGGKIN